MAALTESVHRNRGKTVLYIPQQALPETALSQMGNNKDLLQQLESVVIHWTRQVREVIHTAESMFTQRPWQQLG